MSQSSTHSQRYTKWQSKPLITYDCPICFTTNTNQLLELPCGHNVNERIVEENRILFSLFVGIVVSIMFVYDMRSFIIGLSVLSLSNFNLAST